METRAVCVYFRCRIGRIYGSDTPWLHAGEIVAFKNRKEVVFLSVCELMVRSAPLNWGKIIGLSLACESVDDKLLNY